MSTLSVEFAKFLSVVISEARVVIVFTRLVLSLAIRYCLQRERRWRKISRCSRTLVEESKAIDKSPVEDYDRNSRYCSSCAKPNSLGEGATCKGVNFFK